MYAGDQRLELHVELCRQMVSRVGRVLGVNGGDRAVGVRFQEEQRARELWVRVAIREYGRANYSAHRRCRAHVNIRFPLIKGQYTVEQLVSRARSLRVGALETPRGAKGALWSSPDWYSTSMLQQDFMHDGRNLSKNMSE